MKPSLTYEGDFAGIKPGTLRHETLCCVARQFSDEPTSRNGSLLLSHLLQEATHESYSVGILSIDSKAAPQECDIRAIWQQLIKNEQWKSIVSHEDRKRVEAQDREIVKEILLSAADVLDGKADSVDAMFRFCQFICFFLEHRLSEEKISKIAGLFHREEVKEEFLV